MKKSKVKPRLLKGFPDFMPAQQHFRERVINTVGKVYDLFGYLHIGNPIIYPRDVLEGPEEDWGKSTVQTYYWNHRNKYWVALKFDHTKPLAEFVARHLQDIQLPFKRQIWGPVFRAEKPGEGRYREFIQHDIDIIGTKAMTADAEIVQVMAATMTALGIDKFKIRINNRKVFAGFQSMLQIDNDEQGNIIRVIDKLDKIGWDGVAKELQDKGTDENPGLGLSAEQVANIKAYLDAQSGDSMETLERIEKLFEESSVAKEGVSELREIMEMVNAAGLSDKVEVDPSIARGLSYYTGPVFETILEDCPEIGSVFSGGRFDDLIGEFLDKDVPGVGASIGVDRLIAALRKLNLTKEIPYVAPVIILIQDEKLRPELVNLAHELREAGIATELYLGEGGLGDQVRYTIKRGIPYAIICGESELEKDEVMLKDIVAKSQESIPRAEIVTLLRERVRNLQDTNSL